MARLTALRIRATRERDERIEAHIALVEPIARQIQRTLPPSFELDDLVAAGYLALVQAADAYDPDAHGGTPFSAYARMIIRGRILDSVRRRHYTAATHAPIEAAPEPAIAPDLEQWIDETRQVSRVQKVVEMLPRPERRLLRSHYGPRETTLTDIATRRHITRRKATEQHAGALEHVRRELQRAA